MCGLVGLAGNCTVNMKDVFTDLLQVDVVRGHHSTGAAAVKRDDNSVILAKEAVPGPSFTLGQKYKDLLNNLGVKVFIGHNRYATVGDKNEANAHPFQFDGLVGAHNGTLKGWAHHQLEDYKKFGTDSEALYFNIAKHGLKEVIGDIDGAWALTYFNPADNTINLLRNKERPLFYAYSEDRQTLFWASEAEMLDFVLKRRKVKLYENSIYSTDVDHHYRWVLPDKVSDQFQKPTMAKVEGGTYHFSGASSTVYHYGSGTGYSSVDSKAPTYHAASVSVPRAKAVQAVAPKVDTTKFRPPYKDAAGRIINKVQFEKLTSCGCVFCDQTNSKWGDFIHPLKDDMDGRKLYLCEECYNDDDIRHLVTTAL